MSVSKYKFVSPGVFVQEIDQSKIPAATPARGPVIIGRTERGPAFRPTQVNSFSEYIETFGNPVPGGGGGDVWRDGNYTSPMYASYAAQSWLANGQSATIIRLLGAQHTDATSAGYNGWGGYTRSTDGGGTYGLFLIDSGAAGANTLNNSGDTGTLAAVWYFPTANGGITLSGAIRAKAETGEADSLTIRKQNAALVSSIADDHGFKAVIVTGSAGATETKIVSFNFNPDSDNFIRKVFNTNPILTNTDITETANQEKGFLAHTFERSVKDTLDNSGTGEVYGMILGLELGAAEWSNFSGINSGEVQAAMSGWVISQDTRGATYAGFDSRSTNYVTKLFQFHALDAGRWANNTIKISIANIKASTNTDVDDYGTFDVLVRHAKDTDHDKNILESFVNVNLNPNSPDHIAKRIGNQYTKWDGNERRFRLYQDHPNISKYIRVETNNEGGLDPILLPFGFHGPWRPKLMKIAGLSGSIGGDNVADKFVTKTFATSSALLYATSAIGLGGIDVGGCNLATSSFIYPAIALRASSSDGVLPNSREAYFGYDSRMANNVDRYERSNNDILHVLPDNYTDSTANIESSVAFTLDDLLVANVESATSLGIATYTSGSRVAGTSVTALTGTYQSIIENHGFNKFTIPMFGGHDGWDITESDPIANRNIGSAETTSYEHNTIRRAIDACADPERVDFNIMTVPGITLEALTDQMAITCENRGDALAIIDLPDVYFPAHEGSSYQNWENRVTTKLSTTVTNFKNRKKNSSYGCTYYPWVQIRDSFNNASVWVPPSVVALGTFASSDRVGELWFAPAGFNRGGLSQGSSGLTVTNVTERLTSNNRDDLYEVNINPIASFPNEGIVIFGQKTLDATTSALNRINVRRLLIFLKKEISRLANQVLFDNNVPATWNRFKGLVEPLLARVKARFGLTDYRLVLDETTTTPDLIDRNVMYAKIFLKPARAIEFIALDFVITSTGASFDD